MKKQLLLFCFIFTISLGFSQENKTVGNCTFTIYQGTTIVYQIGTSPQVLGDTLVLCPNDTFQLRLYIHGAICYTSVQWKNHGINIPGANTYTYTVRDTGLYTVHCSIISNDLGPIKVIPCFSTGIKENINSNFLIFPNPSNGNLNIQQVNYENTTIMIYNLIGEIFLTKKLNNISEELDISFLDNGVYYIYLDNGKTVTRQKIIKNAH